MSFVVMRKNHLKNFRNKVIKKSLGYKEKISFKISFLKNLGNTAIVQVARIYASSLIKKKKKNLPAW